MLKSHRVSRGRVLVALLLMTASCRNCDRNRTAPEIEAPHDAADVEAEESASPSYLLLQEHAPAMSQCRYAGVRLGAVPVILEPYTMPAAVLNAEARTYHCLASLSGGTATHAYLQDAQWRIKPLALDESPAQQELLPAVGTVTAIQAVGTYVFVGAGPRFGVIDRSASISEFVQLAQQRDATGKAYDLFAHSEGLLVAIDDILMPFWADLVSLGKTPDLVARWTLPPLVNGSYKRALLHVSHRERLDGELFAFGSYATITGPGQDLMRLPIRAGQIVTMPTGTDRFRVNVRNSVPTLSEYIDYQRDTTELLAGEAMTPWTGMALHPSDGRPRSVLLAAGKRGLLQAPAGFSSETKASAVRNLSGDVKDVTTNGETIYLLVHDESQLGSLMTLVDRNGVISLKGDAVRLPETYNSFVR